MGFALKVCVVLVVLIGVFGADGRIPEKMRQRRGKNE